MNSSTQKIYQLETYDYLLPKERVAQYPASPRDSSRLLFVLRDQQKLADFRFFQLAELLQPDDLLVLNNTKVIPARLRSDRGEVLLVRTTGGKNCWDAMIHPGKHFSPGTRVHFEGGLDATVLSQSTIGRILQFHGEVDTYFQKHGSMPLPPYIAREADRSDIGSYQTIYARIVGSVAAPTAGLHFTRRIFRALKDHGVGVARITLHVGPGTFQPVKVSDITRHSIYPEFYSCSHAAWRKIEKARRVIAVGTTTTRALETIALTGEKSGISSLFIYPGFSFQVVGGLLTNFHLPKSSLLMLVSAFAGLDCVTKAYQHAIDSDYRFYSYGDAMLIL
jgi:S-adenosylmethionine:tRNA ribosyltransferase-isomerase